MPALLRDRLFVVWALLVIVTLFSAEIGGGEGAPSLGSRAAVTVAVLGFAFVKVWLVMFTFMETRTAPIALRVLATGWLAAALGVLLAIYAGVLGLI